MASLLPGRKTVAANGTAERLSTTSKPTISVFVQALSTNTGSISVGGTDTKPIAAAGATRTGAVLAASAAVAVDTDDLLDVWIDSTVNGEGVTFMALLEQ